MKISCQHSGIEAIVEIEDPSQHIQTVWAHGYFYEGHFGGLLEEVYQRFGGQNVGKVYDIGAQRGNHSLWFAIALNAPVLAVEPYMKSYMALDRNLRLNEAGERVTRFMVAAGAASGWCSMEDGAAEGMTHVVPGRDTQVVPMDQYLTDDPIGLIKIDVEGHEMEVLKGLEKTIEKYHPALYIEGDLSDLMGHLERFGYDHIWTGNATPTHGFCRPDPPKAG